jgi:predicted nucleic acid-binding protein
MILVDTSVIVDFLRGIVNNKVEIFKGVLEKEGNFCISPYTYLEILQGAKSESEFNKLKKHLSEIRVCKMSNDVEDFEKAAQMVLNLRNQGITPRNTIDVLIALTAIENNIPLLHNDRDFDFISDKISELRIVE